MKKTLIIVAVVIVIILIFLTRGSTKASVSIGAVLPVTGWGAYWAEPVSNGIKLAVEDIQKEHGDSAINVIIEDDQSAVKSAASAASKLVSIDKVDAVYTEFSSLGLAASPIVQSAGKVLLYSAMTPKILETNHLSVKSFVNIKTACDSYVEYAPKNEVRKIAIFAKIGDVAPTCIASLKKSYSDGDLLIFDNIAGGDFKTLLLKAKQFGANSIIAIVVEADANTLIKQASDMGINIPLFCHKADCMTDKILANYASALEGSIYFDSPISPAFAKKYTDKFGSADAGLMEAAAFSYENIQNLFFAEKTCKKDSQCVVNYFSNTERKADSALSGMRYVDRMATLDQKFYKITAGKPVEMQL